MLLMFAFPPVKLRAVRAWYLAGEWRRSRCGASWVAWWIGQRFACLQCRLLLQGNNLLSGWKHTAAISLFHPIILALCGGCQKRELTLRKHSVNVETIGGAGLIKQRVAHVNAELPGSLIFNHPRVGAAYFVWTDQKWKGSRGWKRQTVFRDCITNRDWFSLTLLWCQSIAQALSKCMFSSMLLSKHINWLPRCLNLD